MGLFNRKKQKEEVKKECTCGNCESGTVDVELGEVTSVKVLGGGCAKCNQLEANAAEALKELGIDIKIEKVKDFAEIAAMGVMSTPALAINDKVVSFGKVIKKDEVVNILKKM